MNRPTHYHVTQHGRTSRPFRYQAHATLAAQQLAGANGTPSGFLPMVLPCNKSACLDPPLLFQHATPARPLHR